MGGLQPIHILIVAIVVLVLFGGSKIPQFMRGLGQGTGEFKKGLEESKQEPPPPPVEQKKLAEPAEPAETRK